MSHHPIIELSTVPNTYNDQKVITSGNIPAEKHLEIPPMKAEENQNQADAHVYLLAGCAAGIMEHSIMYPVDSVKTRMQSLRPHPNAVYRNIKHAFTEMIRTEGIFRPIRGINVVAFGAGPAHALYFCSYENTKVYLGKKIGFDPITQAISAAVACFFHDATMNPVEVIKQRLQMYGSPYRGVYDCTRDILKTEGATAFYRSFSTTLTMNLPFQCIHFVTYEFLRKTLNGSNEYKPIVHLVCGAAAGGTAAAITSPLDVAKTLLNTQEKMVLNQAKDSLTKNRIRGMMNALRTIYTLHGVPGFFRGVQARMLYQMPSTAICWSVYEFFKHTLSWQISNEELIELSI